MELGLKEKVALVAAASRGLGYAVAEALAREGSRLSIVSRSRDRIEGAAEKIRRRTGAEVLAFPVDLRSATEIANWIENTAQRLGGIDLLFSNTGGPAPGSFDAHDDEAWQQSFYLVVMSAVRMARAAVPWMEKSGRGAILFSTSSSVKEPIPGLTLSNVFRASVSAFSKDLAGELASREIRVNQLIPGRIDTERVRDLDRLKAEARREPVERIASESRASIPLGRYGNPGEFAAAATFLLSDAASYITGATLQLDGGKLQGVL